MKLSIVIPLYNSENYINLCLDSILNQNVSKKTYEIIIVDDESSDNSLSILNEYEQRFENVHIYSQKNQGPSIARNEGLKLAKGEFIYFVDSDDYIANDTLNILIRHLSDDIDLLAFNSTQTKDLNLNTSQNLEQALKTPRNIIEGSEFIVIHGFKDGSWWYIVRKDFLLSSNLFYLEGKLLEDISFNLTLLTEVKRVLYIPLDVYRYVTRPNSIMTQKSAVYLRIMISNYERVVSEFYSKIQEFRATKRNMSNKLRDKKKIYQFFLFTRLIRSDMSMEEINMKLDAYMNVNLYPLETYSKRLKVIIMIFIFNNKILFPPFIFFYRILSRKVV